MNPVRLYSGFEDFFREDVGDGKNCIGRAPNSSLEVLGKPLPREASVLSTLSGERAYILTCGTGQGVFDVHQAAFEQVAKSFRIETLP